MIFWLNPSPQKGKLNMKQRRKEIFQQTTAGATDVLLSSLESFADIEQSTGN
jgi:hypothetical protein